MKSKKIFILGGTGMTGQCISEMLYEKGCHITIGARNYKELSFPYEFVNINIEEYESYSKCCFDDYSVVINNLPQTQHIIALYEHLTKSKCIIIDINDDFIVHNQIKNNEFLSENSRIYTGMGLLPGLSNYLKNIHIKNNINDEDYKTFLYLGAKNTGSSNATKNLLQGICCVENKLFFLEKIPFVNEKNKFYNFYNNNTFVAIQHMPHWLILLLRRYSREKVIDIMSNILCYIGKKMSVYSKAAYKSVVLSYGGDCPNKRSYIYSDCGAYMLTAMFLFTIVELILLNKIDTNEKYIRTADNIPSQTLNKFLRNNGIIIATHKEILELKKLSTVGNKNYNKNWYDIIIPKFIVKEQIKTLFTSKLWKKFTKENHILKIIYLIIFLYYWVNTYLKTKNNVPRAMRRDFSMFISGVKISQFAYKKEGVKMYKEMFIYASKKEMRWFFPQSINFKDVGGLYSYIKKYYTSLSDRNIGKYSFEIIKRNNKKTLVISVKNCYMQSIFDDFGIADLQNIMRECEIRAFKEMSEQLNVSVRYNSAKKEIKIKEK